MPIMLALMPSHQYPDSMTLLTISCTRGAGKSECTRCGSAMGRFCRACLSVRYGERLEDVRAAMAAGAWLCPHCYEADHPVRLALRHLRGTV